MLHTENQDEVRHIMLAFQIKHNSAFASHSQETAPCHTHGVQGPLKFMFSCPKNLKALLLSTSIHAGSNAVEIKALSGQ